MRSDPELLEDTEQLTAAPAMHEPSVFGDIPHPIWTAYLWSWGLLFGVFLVAFAADGPAELAVLTASFFALMLLGLPAALGAQAKAASRRPPGTVVTRNGTLPVASAAIQILLIPVGALISLIGLVLVAF